MSDRLTRKAIKHDIRQDEVQTTLARGIDWVRDRPGVVGGLVLGVVVLALVIAGTFSLMASRREAASERLAEAMKIAEAPIVTEDAKPDDPASPSFASEEERDSRAKAAFEKVSGFGTGIAGDVADLYLADLALADGDAAKARQTWEKFLQDHGDHLLSLSVRVNLIHLDRAEGRSEEVEKRLRQELESTEKTLPEDVLLFELAQTLETLERQDEAHEMYQRILDEYPQSPYTERARELTVSS